MRGAVAPGGLQLQHHLSGGVDLHALVGQSRWLVQRSVCHVGCAVVHRAALPFTRVPCNDVIPDFHAFDLAAALLTYKLVGIVQRGR
jgi:hypothetical protein